MRGGGTSCVLLDVTSPPPRRYLSSPKVYSQLVRHASGKVLLAFLNAQVLRLANPRSPVFDCARAQQIHGSLSS